MLERDVLEFACVQLLDHLVPENARLHHVALLHRGDLLAALARELERDAANALDLVGVVDLGVDRALLPVAEIGDGLRLAEIAPAGQFTQDDDVEPIHHLAFEARGVGERGIADSGANIGEKAGFLAQTKEPGLRPHLIRHAVPLWTADCAEDHGVGRVRLGHGRVGDRNLVSVVAAAADQTVFDLEGPQSARIHERDELFHLGHDFRADAIAGEEKKLVGRHRALPRSSDVEADCESRADAVARREPVGKVRVPRATCMSPQRPKVVIVGAGFGGIEAATALSRVAVDVILLDRQNHHCFQPLLYQVASAALSPAEIAWPIRHMLRQQRNATVFMTEAEAVDLTGRFVETSAGPISYDYLVVATGATHSYFGHDDWAEFAPGLKRIEDATRIRRSILLAFEQAELAGND